MKRVACTIILIGLCCAAFGADTPSSEPAGAMQSISEKVAGVKTFAADFNLNAESAPPMSGHIDYKVPDHSVMQMQTAVGEQTVISDNVTTWVLVPAVNMVSRVDMARVRAALAEMGIPDSKPQHNIANPLAMIDRAKATLVGSDKVDEAEVWVIEGPAAKMNAKNMPDSDRIRVYVSKNDGLLRKIEYRRGESIAVTAKYSNIKVNPDFPKGTFSYEPPRGTQVVDRTDMVIQAVRLIAAPKQTQLNDRDFDDLQEPPTGPKPER